MEKDEISGRYLRPALVVNGAASVSAVPATIANAEQFARQMHADQQYGGNPYVDAHVARVVQVVRDFDMGGAMQDAAWLHDVIEDTPATRSQVSNQFGPWVAQLVWACTGEGHNRKTRNASIYEKIRQLPEAAVLKVADRIANVEASNPNSSHRQMYRKEAAEFAAKVAVFVPPAMCDRLERAYAQGTEAREGGDGEAGSIHDGPVRQDAPKPKSERYPDIDRSMKVMW